MTVTAITHLPRQSRRRGPVRAAAPVLTVTFEISLPDDGVPRAASRLLEVARELAGELGAGAVRVAGPPLSAGPADSADLSGTVHLDPRSRTVRRDGHELRLTRIEFDLLVFLARHPSRAFRRGELLRAVWGYDGHTHTTARTVDVHVRRLRAKIGEHRPLVATVHGVGYRLDDRARVSVAHGAG